MPEEILTRDIIVVKSPLDLTLKQRLNLKFLSFMRFCLLIVGLLVLFNLIFSAPAIFIYSPSYTYDAFDSIGKSIGIMVWFLQLIISLVLLTIVSLAGIISDIYIKIFET